MRKENKLPGKSKRRPFLILLRGRRSRRKGVRAPCSKRLALSLGTLFLLSFFFSSHGTAFPSYTSPDLIIPVEYPGKVVSGDLNGDGLNDLAVLDIYNGNIRVYFQSPFGIFPSIPDMEITWFFFQDLALGDLNNDGRTDIAATESSTFSYVYVFYQEPLGVFNPSPDVTLQAASAFHIEIGDLNSDNLDDIVITGMMTNSSIFYQIPDLAFQDGSWPNTTLLTDGMVPVIGDFNSDGNNDLAVGIQTDGNVSIFCQDELLHNFSLFPSYILRTGGSIGGTMNSMTPGDMNGDGLDDLLLQDFDTSISLYYQYFNGTSNALSQDANQTIDLWGVNQCSLDTGDLNNDGLTDFAAANNENISIFYQKPEKFFSSSPDLNLTQQPQSSGFFVFITIEDLDGDLIDDVAGVSDGDGGYLFVYYQNVDPEITSSPVSTAYVGENYVYDVAASDQNLNDILYYSLLDRPSGMTIDSATGEMSWTPTLDDVGTHPVYIEIYDGRGGSASQLYDLEVPDPFEGSRLKFVSSPGICGVEDEAYAYSAKAVIEPSSQFIPAPITYSLAVSPLGMSIDPKTGVIDWLPENMHSGMSHKITVVANLNRGPGSQTLAQTFYIYVENKNDLPSIISSPPTSAVEGEQYAYQVLGRDADLLNPSPEKLAYTLLKAPRGMTIDRQTGMISWVPGNDQSGMAHGVSAAVYDCFGEEFVQSFTVTVENRNDPPVFVSFPKTLSRAGEKYEYHALVLDVDPTKDALSYALHKSPEGMSIDPVTGYIRWIPSEEQIGTHEVSIAAFDGTDYTYQQFDIVVREASPLPASLLGRGTVQEPPPDIPLKEAAVASLLTAAALCMVLALLSENFKYALLLSLFLPLYSKIKKENVLDHFIRGQIYGYVMANPGEHYNSIKRALDLKNGSLAHHIRTLEREELIKSVKDGLYRRYYPKHMKIPQRPVFTPNNVQGIMIDIIRDNPGINQKDIANKVNLSPATVNYHINILADVKLIRVVKKGRKTQCFVDN